MYAASSRDSSHRRAGTYAESAKLSKAITLEGDTGAVIDATGQNVGTTGTGAGILLANPRAGMAVYQNTVTGNRISANTYGIYPGAGTTLTQSGDSSTDVTTPVLTA